MAIEGIGSQQGLQEISPVIPSASNQSRYKIGVDKHEATFTDLLNESIRKVNDVQREADKAIVDLTTGKKQDLHQTMIAIEKADVTFQLMMQVRNKIITAYEEISRMQI